MQSIIPYILAFIVGATIGSFLNVCIYRIPKNLSIIRPSSRCPSCNMPVRPYDNVPLLSYLFLGGRCRFCKTRISLRYPLVEFLNAAFYPAVLWRFGPVWPTLFYCVFCSALIVITFIDLDAQIIPDSITLPGIPIGLLAGSFLLPDPFSRFEVLGLKASLIGAAAGFGIYLFIAEAGSRIFKKEAMGGGDIKMMAMVGACMGWKSVVLTTFLGSLSGSVLGLFLMISKGRGAVLPFGPFLAFGSLITLFWGQEILIWYLAR